MNFRFGGWKSEEQNLRVEKMFRLRFCFTLAPRLTAKATRASSYLLFSKPLMPNRWTSERAFSRSSSFSSLFSFSVEIRFTFAFRFAGSRKTIVSTFFFVFVSSFRTLRSFVLGSSSKSGSSNKRSLISFKCRVIRLKTIWKREKTFEIRPLWALKLLLSHLSQSPRYYHQNSNLSNWMIHRRINEFFFHREMSHFVWSNSNKKTNSDWFILNKN